MKRTILATVATVESTIVNVPDGVSTCSMPQAAFNCCWFSSTLLHVASPQHVKPVQGGILDSLNL